MKKTHSVNISGLIYNIDDDAYVLLNDYLESIKSRFSNEEESNEILLDVEARIAELFQEKISESKQVINIEDVNYVIKIMGAPDDFTDAEYETTTEDNEESSRMKRVYRDPDNRILGGVCSGMGYYFSINPLFFRILFIVLAFTLTGLLIYALLWFVLPEAKTTAEKLEMKGEKVNLSNIQKSLREEIGNMSNTVREISKSPKWQNAVKDIQNVFAAILSFLLKVLKIIGIPIGIFLILGGIFGISSLIGAFFFSDMFFAPTSWDSDTYYLNKMIFMLDTPPKIIAALIFGMIGAFIPLLLIVFAGTKLIAKYRSNTAQILKWSSIVWLVSAISFGVMVWSIAFNYKNHQSVEKIEYIKNPASNIRITMFDDKSFEKNLNGNYIHLDDDIMVSAETKKMYKRPDVNIKKSDDSTLNIRLINKAHGKETMIAKNNAKKIVYDYRLQDSVLSFNPYFYFGDNAKYREQDMYIEIQLPVGQIIYIDKQILPALYYSISNLENLWTKQMVGDYWIMTTNGLSRFTKTDMSVTLMQPYSSEYHGGGQNAITNGLTATDDYKDKNWQGFKNRNFEAVVDMKELVSLKNISIRFLHHTEECIYQPEYVEFYISSDGKKYNSIGKVVSAVSELESTETQIKTFSIAAKDEQARFLRIFAKTVDKCNGNDNKAVYLFTDELNVEKRFETTDKELDEMMNAVFEMPVL